jgi:hypothetical protein
VKPRERLTLAALLLNLIVAACGSTAPSASPASSLATPTTAVSPVSRAESFVEFRDAFRGAWSSLFRAVGNPDTGSGSELSLALDAAARARDVAETTRLAGEIQAELEAGRAHARFGGGWPPAAEMMAQLDRFLAAYQAAVGAERTAVAEGRTDVAALGQRAFEQAGGLEAWQSMREAAGPVASARPAGPPYQCPGVPVSL